jgi:hypothetical protein
MIHKVIFRLPAVEDVVEAAAWYEAHTPGLGEQLVDEILRATRRAQENPDYFALSIARRVCGACSQTVFPTESSFPSSARRSTFTLFFMAHVTIAAGQNDCDVDLACPPKRSAGGSLVTPE